MKRFFQKYGAYVDKLLNLNWKRFNFRFSLLLALIGAIVFEYVNLIPRYAMDPLEPIPYVPVWFYAWAIGALGAFLYYWGFVIFWWLIYKLIIKPITKILIWSIKGLLNK